ncbi:hypothetical protein BJ965_000639 [Streptomyces luteogriseus]|uniref:Uncharacterized protein n=1 Tax=Streptomyces luteogriseus TaxID=68233 RepID=A0A7W7DK40_9ACTN|nr:hypothetical protein [Streptomyces luteogriseus]MBB4710757.1 hypothetical protein [Streptomyces luteogriseus]
MGTLLAVHVHQRNLFNGDRREDNVLAGIFDGDQNRLVVHALA